MKKILLVFLGLVLVILAAAYLLNQRTSQPEELQELPSSEQVELVPTEEAEIVLPVAEFKERITKKPFGIYITPENSPVQPERFRGYHTGVDVEYEDVAGEVPVLAVADGEIVFADWVSGYGGVMVLKSGQIYFFYGHLDQKSFTQNVQVKKGEPIAVLGEGQTQETDFERKHLHFGIIKNKLDLRGYVETEEELSGWYDPLDWLNIIY